VLVPVHRITVAHCYLQKYEYFAGEMYISMSADATCRGLRSPTDGPLTMQLRKGRRSSVRYRTHAHTHTHTPTYTQF